ncbi:SHOCT domain-containing protein [Treponema sp.]|uniref:SHOCT domain-containing protein n=1 Tax=Treponema sp. TaxID=166 RepID=UPI00388E7814
MKFDVSRRFQTKNSEEEIAKFLEDLFRKNSNSANYNNGVLTVELINPTFGSINRKDKTVIEIKPKDNETLLVANVEYKPSGWFWFFVICGLFTTVAWLIPIIFYLYQKNTVKTGIEEIFSRTENEFRETNKSSSAASTEQPEDPVSKLEKLAVLKEKGILSEEEFIKQKQKILENL